MVRFCKNMSSPNVSVIISTHNRCKLLPRAIESVLGQNYQDFELLIVSDGSSDDTEAIVNLYNDKRLRFFQHEASKGASAARNTGLQASTGEYIAFLDDDDEWLPTKLQKQVQLLLSVSENVGLVYCWMDYYDEDIIIKEHHPKLRGSIFRETLDKQPIGNASTLLVRREVIEKVGGFDESLPRGNDGDFIRRVCRNYQVDYVPEVLAKIHVEHVDRISIRDELKDIDNGISNKKRRIKMFYDDFKQCPKSLSNVYSRICYDYLCRYNFSKSEVDLVKALKHLVVSMYYNPFNYSAFRRIARFAVKKGYKIG